MTTWWHYPTILTLRLNWRLLTRVSCILLLCIALITTLFFGVVSRAAPGVNQTIGFQGRLLDTNGDIVPDGYYNIQFKIYEGGSGTVANNPDGTLKWTESYVNNGSATGAVEVKNGFMSVNLGALTPFGTNVDWNQDTIWLSMNIAGASATCTTFGTGSCVADGEMLPMKRMTATPYALNSQRLGGIEASGFLRNTGTEQTASLNLSGVAKATTLQGNTSVIAPLFDVANQGETLDIGTVDAGTINIGTSTGYTQHINLGYGTVDGAEKVVKIGSTAGDSSSLIQGGQQGVRINSHGGFVLHAGNINVDSITVSAVGNIEFRLPDTGDFRVTLSNDQTAMHIKDDGMIYLGVATHLQAHGAATFDQGITVQGGGSVTYSTPGGYAMRTAINIPNYAVGAYSSILAFGLPSSSDATARGLLIADARTGAHQATIGVLSPNEGNVMGFSWNGSNTTGYLTNTANSLALQGNGLDLLTATNNGGQANVGIGNSATAGYALDVTGDINASNQLRIGGVSTLTNSSLNFSAASTASIASASGQLLNIDGKDGVNIQDNGTTVATFGSTNIQIGTGSGTGTPTLLTVDKGASAPSVTGDAFLGSMYYDTTVGALQCYEVGGWGNCSASPDTFVTLSPEFSNAVTNGNGVGTLSSGFCSDDLDINDGSSSQPTVCGTSETRNFYKWTAPHLSTFQTKSIFVTYQLPSNFRQFVSGSTSILGRTDSTNASTSFKIHRSTATGLDTCGGGIAISDGAQTTWQKATPNVGAEPANCGFEAGDSIVFQFNLDSYQDANAYLSDLNFAFSSN